MNESMVEQDEQLLWAIVHATKQGEQQQLTIALAYHTLKLHLCLISSFQGGDFYITTSLTVNTARKMNPERLEFPA
jgi:hypothetical protein